jgi:hypothetical protein
MDGESGPGVLLANGLTVTKGTNAKSESGAYSVGSDGESSGPSVEKLLVDFENKKVGSEIGNMQRSNASGLLGKRRFRMDAGTTNIYGIPVVLLEFVEKE